jgi:hypothetical protein|nr:MAG TPA: hypothetical protein [Caudoviricetes sp.]
MIPPPSRRRKAAVPGGNPNKNNNGGVSRPTIFEKWGFSGKVLSFDCLLSAYTGQNQPYNIHKPV